MPGVIYQGWCDGGPLAGKQLAHEQSLHFVPILRVSWEQQVDSRFAPVLQAGYYEFDEGAWLWRGANVNASDMEWYLSVEWVGL